MSLTCWSPSCLLTSWGVKLRSLMGFCSFCGCCFLSPAALTQEDTVLLLPAHSFHCRFLCLALELRVIFPRCSSVHQLHLLERLSFPSIWWDVSARVNNSTSRTCLLAPTLPQRPPFVPRGQSSLCSPGRPGPHGPPVITSQVLGF